MRLRPRTEIDALEAPAANRGVLVWPGAEALPRLAEENRRLRRGYEFDILGRPGRELTGRDGSEGPVFMTGHQPAFFHAGVWVKHVVASALAARCGGTASFLVVDSDALHGLALAWPEKGSGGAWRSRASSPFQAAGDRSFEQLPAQPPGHWAAFFAEAASAMQAVGASAIDVFSRGFVGDAQGGAQGGVGFVDRWRRGVTAVDRALDVPSPVFSKVSELFACRSASADEGVTAFVAHLLLNADGFAAAYNASLGEYRARRGVRGHRHPIPDLGMAAGRVELPFWLLHETEPRRRLWVSSEGNGGVRLWSETEAVCSLGRGDLRSDAAGTLSAGLGEWEIRPRALALTLYARLFACDLFIHGLGGAKYDQITDGIIRRFFSVEPPVDACVSATLWLPMPQHEASASDRPAMLRRVRDIQFNPQRLWADGSAPAETRVALVEREGAIAESRRLRQAEPRNRGARRAAFDRVRRANEAVLRMAGGAVEAARQDLAVLESSLEQHRITASRDWFFALQSLVALAALREALPLCGRRMTTGSGQG